MTFFLKVVFKIYDNYILDRGLEYPCFITLISLNLIGITI